MANSKFNGFMQKLSVLKSQSSLLAPVAIGLVGILLFIPTQLMSGKLKKQIEEESITKGWRLVTSLSRNPASSKQWEVEHEYQKNHASDANGIALLAQASTQRQLLCYEIFPEPKDTSSLIFEEFGRRFRAGIDGLMARINARECPTNAELQRALEQSSTRYRPGRDWSGTRGRPSTMPFRMPMDGYYGRYRELDATIIDTICRGKAESAGVYGNPSDLSGYEFWENYEYTGRQEAIEDCWYYQLAYWIIEDVIDAIDAMNSDSMSVFTSRVKRLLSVTFTREAERARRSKRGARLARSVSSVEKPGDEKPGYVLSINDGLTESFTRRLCNDNIDVVHFSVAVVVGAKDVLPFMQELCSAKQHKFRGFFGRAPQELTFKHNQITILESTTVSIEPETSTHYLYRYGEEVAVELYLACEYVFNKAGYEEIKPESVKEAQKKPEDTSRRGVRR